MSRGNDGKEREGRTGPSSSTAQPSSRTSIPMTAERARAIQSHADREGKNEDFKGRAAAAADRNDKGK